MAIKKLTRVKTTIERKKQKAENERGKPLELNSLNKRVRILESLILRISE